MSTASRLLTLACLIFVVKALTAQSSPNMIRGKLRENGTPITEATVFLQALDDEKCVKLFTGRKADRKTEKQLGRCVHDITATFPNGDGNYQFALPKSGWYAVHFLWSIGKKPREPQTVSMQGRWSVLYAGYKDFTGKYDAMAQDSPFFFSAKEDAIRDCELEF